MDELAVAGGISREPLQLVPCKTCDLEVPATAEIVIEGEIPIDYQEPEAPFGEYTGFFGLRGIAPVFNVKAITHRRDPITQVFISQMPPSESSKLRQIAYESNYYKFLRYDCHNIAVKQVSFHEMGRVPPVHRDSGGQGESGPGLAGALRRVLLFAHVREDHRSGR